MAVLVSTMRMTEAMEIRRGRQPHLQEFVVGRLSL